MKRVSVWIATYNVAQFIEKTVESALQHEIVGEVIIVDDCSTKDNTSAVCQELERKHDRVRFFTHPDGGNHGAGATWNEAAKHATQPWVAILGSDDLFFANRFDAEKKLLDRDDVDGVHGFMTAHFLTEEIRKKYEDDGFRSMWRTGLSQNCPPDQVGKSLLGLSNRYRGNFSLNGLTFRKSVFDQLGGFNPKLRLHQDSDFIIKLAIVGQVHAGELPDPICSRGVHQANRILNNRTVAHSRSLLWGELEQWLRSNQKNYPITPAMIRAASLSHRIYELAKTRGIGSYAKLGYLVATNFPYMFKRRYYHPLKDFMSIQSKPVPAK